MRRLIIVAAALFIAGGLFTSATADDTNKNGLELVNEAVTAWTSCHTFEGQKNVRRYGSRWTAEELADLTFADCIDLERIVQKRTHELFTGERGREKGEMAFRSFRMELHAIAVNFARGLQAEAGH